MSTLQKYRLITKKKEQAEPNEIRMTARGFNSSYISYAMKIFDQKKFDHVVLKASGSAISKCCIVAEVLRHRIQGLALVSKIKNTQIHDEYEPKEEGLDDVTVTRNIAVLEILLTTDSNEDKNQVGYQAPLTEEEVKQSIKGNFLKHFLKLKFISFIFIKNEMKKENMTEKQEEIVTF